MEAGLEVGDRILEVNGKIVFTTTEDFNGSANIGKG